MNKKIIKDLQNKEITNIKKYLNSTNMILLYGSHGVGKTFILNKIIKRLKYTKIELNSIPTINPNMIEMMSNPENLFGHNRKVMIINNYTEFINKYSLSFLKKVLKAKRLSAIFILHTEKITNLNLINIQLTNPTINELIKWNGSNNMYYLLKSNILNIITSLYFNLSIDDLKCTNTSIKEDVFIKEFYKKNVDSYSNTIPDSNLIFFERTLTDNYHKLNIPINLLVNLNRFINNAPMYVINLILYKIIHYNIKVTNTSISYVVHKIKTISISNIEEKLYIDNEN